MNIARKEPFLVGLKKNPKYERDKNTLLESEYKYLPPLAPYLLFSQPKRPQEKNKVRPWLGKKPPGGFLETRRNLNKCVGGGLNALETLPA